MSTPKKYRYKLYVDLGKFSQEEIVEYDSKPTQEELNEAARAFAHNAIDYNYDILEEDE